MLVPRDFLTMNGLTGLDEIADIVEPYPQFEYIPHRSTPVEPRRRAMHVEVSPPRGSLRKVAVRMGKYCAFGAAHWLTEMQ